MRSSCTFGGLAVFCCFCQLGCNQIEKIMDAADEDDPAAVHQRGKSVSALSYSDWQFLKFATCIELEDLNFTVDEAYALNTILVREEKAAENPDEVKAMHEIAKAFTAKWQVKHQQDGIRHRAACERRKRKEAAKMAASNKPSSIDHAKKRRRLNAKGIDSDASSKYDKKQLNIKNKAASDKMGMIGLTRVASSAMDEEAFNEEMKRRNVFLEAYHAERLPLLLIDLPEWVDTLNEDEAPLSELFRSRGATSIGKALV